MRNVIIHVGLSKCASTLLQKKVFPHLYNFSNIAFAPDMEKYYLFREDMEIEKFHNIVNKNLQNSNKKVNHMIISCEDYTEFLFRGFEQLFFRWQKLDSEKYIFSNKLITENLARSFPDAKIILIIREQFAWAISRYMMNYRGGKTASNIDYYLQEPLEGYNLTIKRYYDYFGKENVLVLPFEELVFNHSGFLDSIRNFINPELALDVTIKRINEAPELRRIVEYERFKNRIRTGIKDRVYTNNIYNSFLLVSSRILTGMLKPWFHMKYGDENYNIKISDSTKSTLLPLFEKINTEVEMLTGLNLHQYGYIVSEH